MDFRLTSANILIQYGQSSMQITVYSWKDLLQAHRYESNCRRSETNEQECEVDRVWPEGASAYRTNNTDRNVRNLKLVPYNVDVIVMCVHWPNVNSLVSLNTEKYARKGLLTLSEGDHEIGAAMKCGKYHKGNCRIRLTSVWMVPSDVFTLPYTETRTETDKNGLNRLCKGVDIAQRQRPLSISN